MHWTDRRERYRTVIAGSACIHPGSVYDAISARIAEELGFEVGMFAGSIASFTVLGAPDLIVLTLTEFAQQAYRINRAGKLPLMVDADHGYGNALNVMRTVQELETAGVAALMIEDTLLPRTFGEKKPTVIPIDEGIGKMKAALAAREDKALTVIGRTSAPSITGLADGIKRLKAYQDTGVDALFIAGGLTRADLDAIAAEVKIPLMLGGVSGDLQDRDYLASRGVRIALQGHQPFSAAVKATYDTLKALREGTRPSQLTGIASADMMARVTRDGDYKSWTEKFLT
ncbi:isocitrate lyase/PEP mutase family protein [Rhodopila sp.]|jgi:carboxyvinyl-carboxyphosphonate phosphorylmutase|uniref:isocitrate lyase/PEP mutase family protein n=1 Tax=Rhodopila sp. TaxID=2480087 RepID=UPI002CB80E6C|nr:isocitrate lyase/PEP mutase family protein [Rhodopila sp.]HVZ09506.1 isocitrate lyase/PEP mutase family protein [Rhodopila sp.]